MLSQLSEGKVLLLSLSVTVVLTALFPVVAGHFGLTFLDALADPAEARALIQGLTGDQRGVHAWITGTLDLGFPLAYGALFLGATLRFFPGRGPVLAVDLDRRPRGRLGRAGTDSGAHGPGGWLAAKAVLTPRRVGHLSTVQGWRFSALA